MNIEVPRLLSLANGIQSKEKVEEGLNEKDGTGESPNAAVTQTPNLPTQRGWQVALLDELEPPRDSGEPLSFSLSLIRELKDHRLHTEPILDPGSTQTGATHPLRIGLPHSLPPSFTREELANTVHDAMEFQKAKTIAEQKHLLEKLMETSAVLLSGRTRQEILERILQAAQESGFDRARLYLLSPDGQSLVGVAAVGIDAERCVGVSWPVAEDRYYRSLLLDPRPRVFQLAEGQPEHSEESLDREGVAEWACVPLVLRGQVIGHLSADNKFSQRSIHELELAPLALLTAQAAAAVEKADLIEQAERKARQLESLRQTTLAITSTSANEQDTLLETIIAQAVGLLHAQGGGIFVYRPERKELQLEVNHGHTTCEAKVLKVGEGVAGRLAISGEPFRIVKDYLSDPESSPVFSCRDIGALLEVPLRWQETIIGVLYLSDNTQRKFTEEDARLLGWFADQAAVVIINRELAARDESKLARLEKLSHAAAKIVGQIGKLPLLDLLTLIAKYASEILRAETCGVSLVKEAGVLSLEASYGHREGFFLPGRQFLIRSSKGTGLTGHIAHAGELFNMHGEELRQHPAVGEGEHTLTPSAQCNSLLAIPLQRREGHQKRLVGLLRADNKKDEAGSPHPGLAFSKEDEWILSIFAEIIVVCLESARQIESINQQRETKERLVGNLPHAVIAADRQGRVTEFNLQAEHILGFAADEVLGTNVDWLYYDRDEPRRVGKQLHLNKDGRIANYETAFRSKTNQRIPIRQSAAWLYNETGNRIGGVGYFEDLSLLKSKESKLALMLKASNAVVKAENLRDGLQRLAEMLTAIFPGSFCRILLFEENDSFLVTEAASYSNLAGEERTITRLKNDIGQSIAFLELAQLHHFFQQGCSAVLRRSDDCYRLELEKVRVRLGLEQAIHSMLMIPIKLGQRTLGLLNLGEFCDEAQSLFHQENIDLATAIAAQCAALIDHMHSLQLAERMREKLLAFYRVSGELNAQQDPQQLLFAIVEETRQAAEAADVHVVLIDEQQRQPQILCVPPKEPSGNQIIVRENGISMQVMHSGVVAIFEDTNAASGQLNPKLDSYGAAICLPLSLPQQRIGVMWIYYPQPRRFAEAELMALQLFVNQAATAFEQANELKRLSKLREIADSLAREVSVEGVVKLIAQQALSALGADGVVFCPYDAGRDAFIHERSVSCGIPSTVWEKYHSLIPQNDGTAHRLMKQGQVYFGSLADVNNNHQIGEKTSCLLADCNARSFLSATVGMVEERLGILYVLYHRSNGFSRQARATILPFVRYAAEALKKARSIEQAKKTKEAADAVAKITILGDRRATLIAIVAEIKEAMGCDAVVLFEYDQNSKRLLPPKEIGVRDKAKMFSHEEERDYPLVYELLEKGKMREVERVQDDPAFKGRRFAKDENIKSCIAVPLLATGQHVGIVFINYRRQRQFTADELHNAQLFANQAALAVHYAQYTDDRAQRLQEQETLVELSEQFLRTTGLQETMDCALRYTAKALGVESCTLILRDAEGNLKLQAQVGWDSSRIGLTMGPGQKSQTGYTVMMGYAVVADDYKTEKRFDVTEWILQRDIRSGMSVPMMREGELVGAMLVYTKRLRHFNEDEVKFFSLIANQTAVAVRSAEQREELRETKGLIGAKTALAWMGLASNAWRHIVAGHAAEIANRTDVIRELSRRGQLNDAQLTEQLNQIVSLVQGIQEKPITPPLTSEEGVGIINVNDLLSERINQLRRNSHYHDITIDLQPGDGSPLLVQASSEWLRRAFDILIDNAVDAVKPLAQDRRVITATTALKVGKVEVHIADTGDGIPAAIQPLIFWSESSRAKRGLGWVCSSPRQLSRRMAEKSRSSARTAGQGDANSTAAFD